MQRRQPWGYYQAVVVRVCHDETADQSRADAPTRGPGELFLVLFIFERDIEGLGEVLPEEVGSPGLKRLAILHHGFDAERVDRAWKFLAVSFRSDQYRHCHELFREFLVDANHGVRL